MKNIWHDIDPARITPMDFIAVVEIEKGSKKKYEMDKETGLIILDRILYTSTHYPANYGFIPRTYADDGDPLDVLILSSESIDPLVMVRCSPIGMINTYQDIGDLPRHVFDEIRHFFTVYKALEGKETAVDEVRGAKQAVISVERAIQKYQTCFG